MTEKGEAQERAGETLQTLTSAQGKFPGSDRTPGGVWKGFSGQTPKDTLNISQSPLHRTLEASEAQIQTQLKSHIKEVFQ